MECIVDTKDLITFTFVLLFVSQMLSFQIFKTGEKIKPIHFTEDFPGGSDSKESAFDETCFDPWVKKIPWRRKWQPSPVLLPGKSHRQRSLVGYSPWDCKESDTTERLHLLMSNYKVLGNRSKCFT